ncbi:MULTISPECIES: LuxR C-terminal-related transcriptional regulator [unclassified Variovorax]|uniref:LuxR C-terminal-related transcriptional regulator n=1 Tax=unclassified Variovorax TaxID=663243 RepID=UPI0008B63019|nr:MULTISPECIES: LuxR C-terminal-related transcriptional regulator [unclassified Variovorax]SEK16883.1 LuxR family transcriptional regulator, maltose regulon positive regulatory protein [Variovorax sp. OK202]SFE63621.1 LuxR family transcriptional regulator, maltose regulon positive regulatory protein [Variovorax sp. OK212]
MTPQKNAKEPIPDEAAGKAELKGNDSASGFQELLLKVTPPRVSRQLISRPRLLSSAGALRDHVSFAVQAPAGFGKTSLLSQWRREYLALGVVVAWVSAHEADDPRRLAQSLALSVRVAAGRPDFGAELLEAGAPGGTEAMTLFLAELAHAAWNIVLIVDEVDRLPVSSREALIYLLRNTPVNTRIVIAARADCQLDLDDLMDYGKCLAVGADALRFRFEETLELVRTRLGTAVSSDTAARLHELTEGWPLGLQLAVALVSDVSDPDAELDALSKQGGRLREHLVSRLLANLAPADLEFLTRISILDPLHPQLCCVVGEVDDARERLERMSVDTPILIAGEKREWLRMHSLARDALLLQFARLPADQRKALHERAAQWLIAHGHVEPAAWHALEAGQYEQACDLAETSLYEFITTIMTRGRLGVVTEWLAMLPPAALESRPRLLLAAAWAMALSQRDVDAGQLVARVLARPDVDEAVRCECALILSGGALFADDPDRAAGLHAPWPEDPPLRDPLLRQIFANRTAYCTLLEGDPALARLRQQRMSRQAADALPSYLELWGEFHIAMTHVWEIQMQPAERMLRGIQRRAESELARRNPFVCQVAALLAAVLWERDAPVEAINLLANRLDVIEQTALPSCLLLAYRTLASIELARGTEQRALGLLEAMGAAGSARGLERIRILSLCDQVRLHARRYRAQTCADLCLRIDAELDEAMQRHGPLWHRMVAPARALAWAYAAVAARDWERVLEHLEQAEGAARALRMGRVHLEVIALRSLARYRSTGTGDNAMREAIDLAASHGLLRIFEDAHPELGEWARELSTPSPSPEDLPGAMGHAAIALPDTSSVVTGRRTPGSTALTPKEREVLDLLERNLSNKEIGVAMQVGEETIKWHVKNLFTKLNASSRKHVVLRARVLGLLAPGD